MEKMVSEFEYLLREITYLNRSSILCDWEIKTGCSETSQDGLIETESYIMSKLFDIKTCEKTGELLKKLNKRENFEKLSLVYQKTVKKLLGEYEKNSRIPKDFYDKYIETVNKSQQVWEKAKRNNDYSSFEPYLSDIVDMTIKMCGYMNPDKKPYEVMLEKYEQGYTTAELDRLFASMKPRLKEIINKAEKIKYPDENIFKGKFPVESQKKLSCELLEYIGFDIERGVVSESEHPFTTALSKNDVRLTDHYCEDNIVNAIFSIIHEGGHGIFEQNVDESLEFTPFYSCEYMGIHESQSRFYENILARNINFWKPVYGKISELFPEFGNIPLQDFYLHINRIKCSPVRIEADDITYCFHIIIRYELEKGLFDGSITTKELPDKWRELYEKYLGVTPKDDAEGVLQDTHWSAGDFGYFPTYLLGTIYDGMFLKEIGKELGNIDTILEEGKISEITKWFNEKVHRFGGIRTPKEMIDNVFGREVTADDILDHFENKLNNML